MRMITLKNGMTFEVSDCGAADGILWITFAQPMDIVEASRIFCEPENTAVIHHAFGENDKVDFEGYTALRLLQQRDDGLVIALKKG